MSGQRALLGLLVLAAISVGCSRDEELRCEDPSYYSSSATIPPIRVPEDLSLPNESDSLTVPSVGRVPAERERPAGCLEAPPDFFEDDDRE